MAITSKRKSRTRQQLPPTGWLDTGKQNAARSRYQPSYPRQKLQAASRRIGEKPIDQFRWALARFQEPRNELRSELARGIQGSLFYELGLFVGSNPECSSAASREVILATFENIIADVRQLLTGSPWRSQIASPITQVISKEYEAGSWKAHFERSYQGDDFATALVLRVGDLLMQSELARLLAACSRKDCGRLFIKRKRGLFCCRQCVRRARLEHVKNWRSRQSAQELSDRRHLYYLNRLPKEIRNRVRRRTRKTE